jgi:hypothetical protein
MDFLKTTFVSITVFGLVGCGAKLPECGDSEALNLVKEIISENSSQVGLKTDTNQIVLEGIETLSKDEKLKKNECQATLSIKLSGDLSNYLKIFLNQSEETQRDLGIGLAIMGAQSMVAPEDFIAFYGAPGVEKLNKSDNSLRYAFLASFTESFTASIQEELDESISEVGTLENQDTLKQTREKLKYAVRKSEDKSTKQEFIVEVVLPEKTFEVLTVIDQFRQASEKGQEFVRNKR